MGRKTAFDSKWVVDRKFFDGTTWILRFTACSNPRCASCRGTAAVPVHGPYWAYYVEVDGRSHLRHHSVLEPLPWGDAPPPSLLPSDADPTSRRNVARAQREAAAEARARATQAAAQERAAADQAAQALQEKRRQAKHEKRLRDADLAVRRIRGNLATAREAGHARRVELLVVAAERAQARLDQLRDGGE